MTERHRALVVEDDPDIADLLVMSLESGQLDVVTAASGATALEKAQETRPDLITLDIVLPGMDGWDFLARIKDLPAWANVPVVVVSVEANHEVGLSLGARAVLQKPFGPADLRNELERLGFQPGPSRNIKVLIVDDDPRALELMSVYLKQPGYTVLTAYGGQEGIALAQQHLPDLVVLDLLMPDIGGIEVVEALKKDEATAQIPVIMVTARQFTDAERAQLSSHASSVVSKSELHDNRFIGEVRRAFQHPAVPA